MEMNADSSSDDISLVGRNVNTQQTHENRFIQQANDEASEEDQYVEPSTLSEAPVYEAVSRVYQLNDKM